MVLAWLGIVCEPWTSKPVGNHLRSFIDVSVALSVRWWPRSLNCLLEWHNKLLPPTTPSPSYTLSHTFFLHYSGHVSTVHVLHHTLYNMIQLHTYLIKIVQHRLLVCCCQDHLQIWQVINYIKYKYLYISMGTIQIKEKILGKKDKLWYFPRKWKTNFY